MTGGDPGDSPAATRRKPAGDVSDGAFRAVVAVGGLLLVVLILWVRFGYDLELPTKPPPPHMSEARARGVSRELERNPAVYTEILRRDAAELGVPVPSPEDLGRALPYFRDDTARTLAPGTDGATVDVGPLRLTAVAQAQRGSGKELLVLEIENLTGDPLAYHVVTRPSPGTQACHEKLDLPHNAVAVAPHDAEIRSECMYLHGWTLEVRRVETLALSHLQFHEVSRLLPTGIGLEARAARGHRPPSGVTCNVVLSADVTRAIEEGSATWRDLIDFYARHPCSTYSFVLGYKAFTRDGERELPVEGAER